MDLLSAADVYAINEEVLGHEPLVRDRHLLRSAVLRPYTRYFGEEAYPTLMDKAAALLHALAYHHLFYDGNKRTAMRATIKFLRFNDLEPTWTDEEAYQFILEIAQGKRDIPEIAAWLEQHTRPLQD
jgi:death-on-curing protein